MKALGIISAAALFSITMAAPPARAQQCPDTCNMGTCSNNAMVTCSTDADCVQADIATACPCTGPTNHGRYVSCVAHARNKLRREGCPTARIARCAARSTCGKANAVLCCKVVSTGSCTVPAGSTTGTCADGTACTADVDCSVIKGPRVGHDAASCNAVAGWYSSGTGSACQGCEVPVACCLPAGTCEVVSATDCGALGGTSTTGAAPTCSGVTCP